MEPPTSRWLNEENHPSIHHLGAHLLLKVLRICVRGAWGAAKVRSTDMGQENSRHGTSWALETTTHKIARKNTLKICSQGTASYCRLHLDTAKQAWRSLLEWFGALVLGAVFCCLKWCGTTGQWNFGFLSFAPGFCFWLENLKVKRKLWIYWLNIWSESYFYWIPMDSPETCGISHMETIELLPAAVRIQPSEPSAKEPVKPGRRGAVWPWETGEWSSRCTANTWLTDKLRYETRKCQKIENDVNNTRDTNCGYPSLFCFMGIVAQWHSNQLSFSASSRSHFLTHQIWNHQQVC